MQHAFDAMTEARADENATLARLKPALRLVGYVVILPLALLCFGVWQIDREAQSRAEVEQARAELPQTLDRLRALAARNPNAVVRFEGAKTATTASLAAAQIQEHLVGLDRDLLLAEARRWLAGATVLGAALALAAGLTGLVLSTVAGAFARLSRDRLVVAFSLLRRVLPVILAAQVAGLAAATLGAGLFEAGGLWFAQKVSAGGIKLLLGAVLLGGGAVYAAFLAIAGLRRAFALFTPEPLDVLGRAVDETQAPGLWRFTRELARREAALAPDHVVVGLTEGFFVTSAAVRLWPEDRVLPEGRTLYVPAAYLGVLDGREVAAIIGHELAHFSGEDTAYSQRFAPIYASLEHAFAALAQEGGLFVLWPSLALGGQAIGAFDRAVAHWRRLREFEADRRGSLTSGPEAAASALLRTGLVSPVIDGVLERAARRPERAGDDLVASVRSAMAESELGDPRTHLDDRQPHPTDSHPPMRQRIAALEVALDDRLLGHAARPVGHQELGLADAFFADWPKLCRRLSADFLGHAGERQAAMKAALEEATTAAPAGETPLFENSAVAVWTFGIMAALFAAAAAALHLFAGPIGLAATPVVHAVVVGVAALAALGFAAYAVAVRRRGQEPFLVLSPEGFRSPLLRQPVAWLDVAGYQVVQDRGLSLVLGLGPDCTLPEKVGRSLRARISRRKRLLTLTSLGTRGLKPDAYADLVGRYLNAARARDMLAEQHSG